MSLVTTLAGLASEFQSIAAESDREVGKVVKKGALEIKKKARSTAIPGGGRHAPGAGAQINFDMIGATEAEVGYDKRGQGNLGAILEYGSIHNPPHNDLGRALEAEAPVMVKYIGDAMDNLWR